MDRNLRAFSAVASSGNLTLAAEQIGLTQPALTKTIRRLENEFGAKLFIRTSRGMVLTEAGRKLRARVQAIEMHYRQAREEIEAITSGTARKFVIAAGAAYHMTIAPDLVKLLSTEFPADRLRPRLRRGRPDIAEGDGWRDRPDARRLSWRPAGGDRDGGVPRRGDLALLLPPQPVGRAADRSGPPISPAASGSSTSATSSSPSACGTIARTTACRRR